MTWPFIWNLISLYQITLWEKLSTRNVDKWIRQTITDCLRLLLGLRYIFECQPQSKDTKNDNFKRLVTFFWRVKTHANYQSTCQCFFNWHIMKWKTLFSQLGSFNVKYVIFVTSKNWTCIVWLQDCTRKITNTAVILCGQIQGLFSSSFRRPGFV